MSDNTLTLRSRILQNSSGLHRERDPVTVRPAECHGERTKADWFSTLAVIAVRHIKTIHVGRQPSAVYSLRLRDWVCSQV